MHGVQVRSSGSTGGYVDLINKWGSAWETPNAPSYPLDVNIIGADGDAVRGLGIKGLASELPHVLRRNFGVRAAGKRLANVQEDLRW